MITLVTALVIAVVASLQLKKKITIKERCTMKTQLWTIFMVSCLPTLVLAMAGIASFDLFGLCIMFATAMVFFVTRAQHIKIDQYTTCCGECSTK